ncbi:MAG: RNA polymerase sigma factor RpoD/SigA [Cyanobacteria bacterium HKST-UBA02]|nr:RNA polymerase sigma factor RpoD/SigA [Cyanobacteria bacterium HKST-UBA02]
MNSTGNNVSEVVSIEDYRSRKQATGLVQTESLEPRSIRRRLNMKAIQSFLRAAASLPRLTEAQEKALIEEARDGNREAADTLILSHMKVVTAMARRYNGRGLPLQDLVQEGAIGLMTALDKFDPDKEIRFSTYATWWVREAMTRSLSNKSRNIRIPVHLNEFMTKLRRVRSEMSIELGRKPEPEELSRSLGVSREKVESALIHCQPCESLDQKISTNDSDGCTLSDTVVDCDANNAEQRLEQEFTRKRVEQLLKRLSDKEQTVIRLRFGLKDNHERSLREVSKEMRLTRDQVGKISCRAMRKLKEGALAEHMEDCLA